MLDNFLFSVSIAMPIFLVMCIGYILKRKGFIDDNFIKTSSKVIFNIALPIKIFHDVLTTSLHQHLDVQFIAFIIIGTILSVIAAWGLGLIVTNKEKSQLGAFIQGCFRGNFLYVGLSLMENITGSIGLKAPLAIIFYVPLYNILAVIILTLTNVNKSEKINIKNILMSIVKNPLIIATLLGVAVSYIDINLPVVAFRTMGYFREVVTPLALLTIGASFGINKSSKSGVVSLVASLYKLIILPLAAVLIAVVLKFSNEDILLIYVFFGVPTSTVSYVMAAAMNGDKDLAANIIMTTTLLSVLTMTLFIFACKTIGIVS